MKTTNLEKEKKASNKLAAIVSITVKNEGRALNIIFILCLICIFGFCVFLYRTSTGFYQRLDETMQNNVNLHIELLKNEHIEYFEETLNNKLSDSNIET